MQVEVTVARTNQRHAADKFQHVLYAISEPVPQLNGEFVFIDLGRNAQGTVPANKNDIVPGARLRVEVTEYNAQELMENAVKKRKATYWGKDVVILSLPSEVAANAQHVQFVSSKPRIELMPPSINGNSLLITVHYYEDGVAKDDVRLFAYAGNKQNPLVKALEDLPGKGEETFDLYTWNYGVAQSEVLISELPQKCSRITVVGPNGVRVSKELSKDVLKSFKKIANEGTGSKKLTTYNLLVDVVSSEHFTVVVTADKKPVATKLFVRAIGYGSDGVKIKDLNSQEELSGPTELSSDQGSFEFMVKYGTKSIDIDVWCPQFNLRKRVMLWKGMK